MHPVLQHIWERRNKRVPVKDGRKIVLLLFGGIMAGVRGAGAVTALKDLGLDGVFDEIYGFSAGFANAAYMLSGNPRVGTSIYYQDLSGKKFINSSKPWNLINIDYLIEVMKTKKKLNVKAILKHKTKFYAGVMNIKKSKVEYLEVHKVGEKNFFKLMSSAVSVPFLHPGGTKLGKNVYKDPYIKYKEYGDYLDHVYKSGATDILVIYNYQEQMKIPAIFSDKIYQITANKGNLLSIFETRPKVLVAEKNRMYYKVTDLFRKTKT